MTPAEIGGLIILLLNLVAVGVAVFKLGGAVQKFEMIGEKQAMEITELKNTVKVVGELVVKIAVSSERMDNMSSRLNRVENRVEEMAHGEGYVLPLRPPGAGPP